jgi:hypothetical protein
MLIRLAKYAVDILITVNIPHNHGEYDPDATDVGDNRMGLHIEKGEEIRAAILRSFDILDYSLFLAPADA